MNEAISIYNFWVSTIAKLWIPYLAENKYNNYKTLRKKAFDSVVEKNIFQENKTIKMQLIIVWNNGTASVDYKKKVL